MRKEDKEILKEIKESIRSECITYSELAWLYDHQEEVLNYGI